MTLPSSGIWMRVWATSIKGVKVNNKRSFVNLTCRFCDDGSEESQEHLERCGGCLFERRNLDKLEGAGDLLEKNDCRAQCWGCRGGRVLLLPDGTLT